MKRILIISLDIIKESDPPVSLNIGSLISVLKNDSRYNESFIKDHRSVNLYKSKKQELNEILENLVSSIELNSYDFIAIGLYIWSEFIINEFIGMIRKVGFRKKLILGGPQISNKSNLTNEYPSVDYFIIGYAEIRGS